MRSDDAYLAVKMDEVRPFFKKNYSDENIEYIYSIGMKMLDKFQIQENDENILLAYLCCFVSSKSKVSEVMDLRKVKEVSSVETAEILRDVLLEIETDVTAPILKTIRTDEHLKSFLKKQKIR